MKPEFQYILDTCRHFGLTFSVSGSEQYLEYRFGPIGWTKLHDKDLTFEDLISINRILAANFPEVIFKHHPKLTNDGTGDL